MPAPSPTISGLRTAFRHPVPWLAEVAWRWVFGAAALALLSATSLEYLDTLPVSGGELLFLRSRQPLLISRAVAQILAGSGQRLVFAILIAAVASSLLWLAASSLGSIAVLESLLTTGEVASPPARSTRSNKSVLRSILSLNFLRLGAFLAAIVGFFGSAILAGFASTDANPRPGMVFLLFVLLLLLLYTLWAPLNWLLSTAPLFVLGTGQNTFGSVSSTVRFLTGNLGAVSWATSALGLIHFTLFMIGTAFSFVPLAFAAVLPSWLVFAGTALMALLYFAAADFLHVARFAAYMAILDPPEAPAHQLAAPIAPSPRFPAIPSSDDDILSDIPGLLPPEPSLGS